MKRVIMGVVLGMVLLAGVPLGTVWGADLKAIQMQKTKDMVVTLLSESGQWTQGKNSFGFCRKVAFSRVGASVSH